MSEVTPYEARLIAETYADPDMRARMTAAVQQGTPLAYLIGEWAFYGEVYTVTPDVLIPRPDTEILVEQAIKRIPENGVFLDLCTGSGCVAVSVLAHRPDLHAVAVDISDAALKIAQRNALRNGVADRFTPVCLDVLHPELAALPTLPYCAICANPPYIDTAVIDTLSPEVHFEPRIALDGGADGMDFYRAILHHFSHILPKNGIILLEIGYDQAEKIRHLAHDCQIVFDYGKNPRVAVICCP